MENRAKIESSRREQVMERNEMIVKCDCQHKAQDELHGKGNRVANFARNANNKQGGYVCTVCTRVHPK